MKHLVGTHSELTQSGVLLKQVEKKMVALFLVEGEVVAIEDLCPHRAGPLSEGHRRGNTIVCPWHQSEFDLKTCQLLKGPSTRPLKRFVTEVEADRIYVVIPD